MRIENEKKNKNKHFSMGPYISRFYELFASRNQSNPMRILLLGLDNAGKTSILYKLKLKENVLTIPTIGFNVETVHPVEGVTFTVWDIGGQHKIRPLWRHYYQNTDGLAYVIDSSDFDRISEAAEELHSIVEDELMHGVPIVVIANKQDLPNAVSCSELIKRLELDKLRNTRNKWFIQSACATSGEGIYESMHKLSDMINENI